MSENSIFNRSFHHHSFNWNIEQLGKTSIQKYMLNKESETDCETCLDCLRNSHYCSNVSWEILADSKFSGCYFKKLTSWNKFNNEFQKDLVYEGNQCFRVFDHLKAELNRSFTIDQDKYLQNSSEVVTFQFQFYLYVILFNLWCLEIIWNQISHVENSASLKDSRLSNIMHLIIDICHTE